MISRSPKGPPVVGVLSFMVGLLLTAISLPRLVMGDEGAPVLAPAPVDQACTLIGIVLLAMSGLTIFSEGGEGGD